VIWRSTRHVSGVTLVEVLITLVIMSVGLLGVAALQLATLRGNYTAFSRSQASVLAGDILDRMRANRTAARDGQYAVGLGAYSSPPDTPAGHDLTTWKTSLAAQLPAGDGSIVMLADPVNVVEITIQWGERVELPEQGASPAPASTVTFRTRTRI
jgi:type IV pilus assembly protein PilV